MATATLLEPTVNDPLLTLAPFEYEGIYYPFGFPVRLRSNSPTVLQAAECSWGAYRRRQSHSALEIRLALAQSSTPGCLEPPVFRSQGHLLSIVADRENFAMLDLNAGFAFGWATEATARNQDYFRQCLLHVIVHPLLEIRHLITLHAACVMHNQRGLLLAGQSGAGKSSLSYACARRGWTFVSDDASAFQRDAPYPMVIGNPQKFRFRDTVGRLFPEFIHLDGPVQAFGKRTVEVSTMSLHNIVTAEESPVDAVVFLNRTAYKSGPPVLIPVLPEEAWRRLSFSVWALQMPAYEQRLVALERLLTMPMYEMHYSDMDEAIDLLESTVQDRLR